MTLSSEVPTDQEQKRDRRPWSYGPEVKYMHNLMGCRGGGTGRVIFRDVEVPRENVVGEVDGGERVFNTMMIPERLGTAAITIRPARAALEVAGGSRRPVSHRDRHPSLRDQPGRPRTLFRPRDPHRHNRSRDPGPVMIPHHGNGLWALVPSSRFR